MTKTKYNFKKAIIRAIKRDNRRRKEMGLNLLKLSPMNINTYAKEIFEYMDENIEHWLDDLIGQRIWETHLEIECKIKNCFKTKYEIYHASFDLNNEETPYCEEHYFLLQEFKENQSYSKTEVEN